MPKHKTVAKQAVTSPAATSSEVEQLKAQLAALQSKVEELEQRTDAQSDINVSTGQAVEMVQKAATVGIAVLAAVSAPTALGVQVAEECGQTLIGFARGAEFSVYSHPDRIVS